MAERLEAAGLICDVCPLLAAVPTRRPLPADCFEHVIFVSEHAVQMGQEALTALAPGAQWYAVGPATGRALTIMMEKASHPEAGRVRIPELAQSEGLLREPGLKEIERHRILLVAGEGGRELIATTLTDRGAQVTTWLVYQRQALDSSLASNARIDEIDVCIASSGKGLELLSAQWLAGKPKARAEVPVCVPSPRIAKMAVELGWQEPIICSGASAQATLDGLADAGLLSDLKQGKPT